MNSPPVSEKTREYPIKNHWNETMARETMDRNNMESAFLRRVRPE